MLVAIVGLACAGKTAVAEYLETQHGFQRITLSGEDGPTDFASPDAMLHHVTAHWRTRFVTLDLDTAPLIDLFEKRPFFLLIGVEAPLMQRWHRACMRAHVGGQAPMSLESFVSYDDAILYGVPPETDDADTSVSTDIANMSLMSHSGATVSASLPSAGHTLTGLLQRCHLRIANTFAHVDDLHAPVSYTHLRAHET